MGKEEVRVAFLDVGQGDSTVIVLPDRSTAIVVDCPSKKTTIDYLDESGIVRLSHVFISHSDNDHIGGVVDLVANFRQIGNTDSLAWNLDTYRVREGRRKVILRRLLDLCRHQGLKLIEPRSGMQFAVQNLVIDVLHPDTEDLYEAQLSNNPNDASVLLRLTFDRYRMLLTGDIQAQGWLWVSNRNPDLKAELLKFPHHGAWYEPNGGQPSLPDVMRLIDPILVILSLGSDNSYQHPHPKTIDLLCSSSVMFAHTQPTGRCYSTLESRRGPFSCAGTVEAIISKKGIKAIGETSIDIS